MRRFVLAFSAALLWSGCIDAPEAPPDAQSGSQVAIDVAPLDLPGLGDACYSLTVENGAGDVVWTRSGICADQFGDGSSSISYVGTCDASDGVADNTVGLVVEELVRTLDTQTPQVLIEARIVEATSQYNRDVGIQWGGDGAMSDTNGNPTGLAFPYNWGIAGGATDQNTPLAGLTPFAGATPNPNFP